MTSVFWHDYSLKNAQHCKVKDGAQKQMLMPVTQYNNTLLEVSAVYLSGNGHGQGMTHVDRIRKDRVIEWCLEDLGGQAGAQTL